MITDERLAMLIRWSEGNEACAIGIDAEYVRHRHHDTVSALRELQQRRKLSGPMAPIARVTVENCGVFEPIYEVVRTELYAPGLPEGDHDLYPEPPQREPIGPMPEEGA